MDRRSWPWRKKSSEKIATATNSVSGTSAESQENSKKTAKYVQISQERYACLSGMEDQVKTLNEKLSTALSDISNKENLVKQHTKVAEEAVSGWEKAEAEALELKNQLESVTLLKLTAEDRAAHLDGALKECMKQIRNVKEENEKQLKNLKEESEQKLHDVIFTKTNQWEKVKTDLENKIEAFQQELLRSSADNDLLSRALQERSNMLMKISEEKAQVDSDIEVLKADIQSCEKEISSLKYEVHIVTKELEIRNEEKNMCVRSADVANKQHLEDVKKITKLEAECQRLRGLVRKKLPGPAVLAQMKLEADSLEKDYVEVRLRKSPVKNSSPRFRTSLEFSHENIQQLHKENEFLTSRLLTMEEETKMLKEVLSKRNSELQASRLMFSKTASRPPGVDSQMFLDEHKYLTKANSYVPIEGSYCQNESDIQSLASMSEYGADDECRSESWATGSISDFPHYRKEKTVEKHHKKSSSSQLEFMDDFLEMEKLACLSAEPAGFNSVSNSISGAKNTRDTITNDPSKELRPTDGQCPDLSPEKNMLSSIAKELPKKIESDNNENSLSKLKSKIASVIELKGKDSDVETLLGDIKCILQGEQEAPAQHSTGSAAERIQLGDTSGEQKNSEENNEDSAVSAITMTGDSALSISKKPVLSEDLKKSVSQIHDFVVYFGKEAIEMSAVPSVAYDLGQKIGEFSYSVDRFLSTELSANDFILALSCALSQTTELSTKMLYRKSKIGECNSSDCVDKVTLSENKVQHEPNKETFSDPSLDPEDFQGQLGPDFEAKSSFVGYQDLELLKEEKEGLAKDLELTNCKLYEAEQHLTVLKADLAASQDSKSLADTQLKCMAESYKLLESHCQELEDDIKKLQTKADKLEIKLQEERHAHEDDLAKLKAVQEEMERKEQRLLAWEAESGIQSQQDKEIAAAAEKLAECQETIFLLGKHLKALNPQEDLSGASLNEKQQMDGFTEDIFNKNGRDVQRTRKNSQHSSHGEIENIASILQRTADESAFDENSSHFSPSDTEASSNPKSPVNSKRPKHRSTWSTSSSSSNPATEKHGRGGFSRFFSKGWSDH